MRRRASRPRGIASGDLAALRPVVRRTRLARAVLSLAAVALLAGGVAWARTLESSPGGLLPGDSTAVVVLDLSLSITDDDYPEIRGALQRLIDNDTPLGLVVFSDTAYELVPPGSPATSLQPLLRFLAKQDGSLPVNPWAQTFRAGTRISSALDLAREMIERDEIENASIVLISDLETAPDDVPPLARTVDAITSSGITIRVVGLAPSRSSQVIFRGLLGEDAFLSDPNAESSLPRPPRSADVVPLGLVVLGVMLFLALALGELYTSRLGLPPSPRPGRAEA